MYVHMYCTCMHNMYIYTYIHTYYVHTCILYVRTYIHTYVHSYVHTYTRMHTYMHTHTYLPTYIHAYMHTYIHTYIHTCMHAVLTHVPMPVCTNVNCLSTCGRLPLPKLVLKYAKWALDRDQILAVKVLYVCAVCVVGHVHTSILVQ